jgi:O6-methylguanine-DNA--protein-cysteine methyltransferase
LAVYGRWGQVFKELRAIHAKYEQREKLLCDELNKAFESIKMYDEHVKSRDSYFAKMRDIYVKRWRRTQRSVQTRNWAVLNGNPRGETTYYLRRPAPIRANSKRTVQVTRTETTVPIVES